MLREPEADSANLAFQNPAFQADVLRGLGQSSKAIPARWFYDDAGSALFEAITQLPEYYPTRVESGILEASARARLPASIAGLPKLGFFPGSTIGNLAPAAAVDLLRAMRATLGEAVAGRPGMLLIGKDRVKPADVLTRASDDVAGVTAAFNLNLAARINRELGGTIPLDALRHRAVWNADMSRIEMHLQATRAIRFTVADHDFAMAAGETTHTENSHKYDPPTATTVLIAGGWTPVARFTDAEERFMVVVAEAQPSRLEP